MWKALLTLALASHCLAAPQQNSDRVDTLLQEIFATQPPQVASQGRATGSSLDALINNYQNPQSSTSPTTYVGTQNRPVSKPDDCECVPYYLCRNGTIIKDGYGVIDIRSAGACADYIQYCCKPPDRLEPQKPILPPRIERKGCGQRNVEGVGFRIIGDKNNETQFGEFPWMVAILKEEIMGSGRQNITVYQCGGSLIHKQAILTAAHCVQGKDASTLMVRAGEWDTQTRDEIYPHQDRRVQKVIVHDKYYPGGLFFDYAILILSEPFKREENVDVVCLPDPNVIYDGSRCFATGWGKDKFGIDGHYQVILKKIDLPVVPHNTCQSNLQNTRLGKYFQLHETFICAGGEPGKDTCKGDGGSPLVCPSKKDPTRYQQAGIVAWGIGCGDSSTPGVYANVAYARDWIDNQIAYHNLDNTVYNL
ncbi:phenoloxidase-activating factor 2 isoform X2 [Halictus rubicundus]|uniref:phenoloxidase-activating factor 2 isoform X2 n=1 Tax=Halictus rubicundus TaxID=77578 RepID=UPI004034F9A9